MRIFLLISLIVLFSACSSEDKSIKKENINSDNIEEIKNEDVFKDAIVNSDMIEDEFMEKEIDAKNLYKACSSCHGEKGEFSALGVSKPIIDFSKEELLFSFYGYIDGSYGGAFKNIMKPHLETKSKEELEILADYIVDLK
ncbi:Cytochrome c-553 precursor [Aliarcobacter thereius]|uniref:Cytochrome c-553 n=2 Tax=Aliarcobacter thereius TaxID=544718 RepID=A0A1C0B8V6_9BACT|nr:hypothetical protein [Aliarcobacter thereius]OCL88840.1 Cytochrome c-553 precursor [Aliarcobacter thereius]OCL92333.1 Cytochrome c-553 precursor [Aliarcobacter thereius]OCL94572.1 Cytochrome c-553 precursor [Aliarcobacter thereius LMG 24486]OCM00011.1 Cytochrome c-553 precursor [Aliarcobacter thereius]QBF15550.1 cytochrome c [Aliarcobacter thereius LMG 24486]